jgi:serine protease DegQ
MVDWQAPAMMRLWLIFAQTTTVCLAALFVVSTLKPEWLPAKGVVQIAPIVQSAPAQPSTQGVRLDSYHDAVAKALPSVVDIYASKEVRVPSNPLLSDPQLRRFFGDQPGSANRRANSVGSGVIVSAAGYILTNHHVVDKAEEIEVVFSDGKKRLAKVVGSDPDTDLAVLRVEAPDLPVITFGSSDSLRVGDVVLAVGNPLGIGQTVTSGIVSGLGRTGLGINTFEDFIQTDAAINQGNSGGALLDARGNLVGINTAILSQTGGSIGIGLAIPATMARLVMEQIIRTGHVTRGWIGVELQPITPALVDSFRLASAEGAIIGGVLRNGPADKAGAKPGDVLLSIDGTKVADPQGVLKLVAGLEPGRSAVLKVSRKGEQVSLPITVGRRPKPQARAE